MILLFHVVKLCYMQIFKVGAQPVSLTTPMISFLQLINS